MTPYRKVAICLVAIVPWLTPFSGPALGQGGANVYTVSALAPIWMDGGVNQSPGSARVLVEDINQDGVVEIVSCALGHAFALARSSSGTYETLWYSDQLACLRLAIGDSPSGGGRELYVLTEDGRILVYSLNDCGMVAAAVVGPGSPAHDVAVGDVDGDGKAEVVVGVDFSFEVNALIINQTQQVWYQMLPSLRKQVGGAGCVATNAVSLAQAPFAPEGLVSRDRGRRIGRAAMLSGIELGGAKDRFETP